MSDKKRLTVMLDADLIKRFKVVAVNREMQPNELLSQALEQFLSSLTS